MDADRDRDDRDDHDAELDRLLAGARPRVPDGFAAAVARHAAGSRRHQRRTVGAGVALAAAAAVAVWMAWRPPEAHGDACTALATGARLAHGAPITVPDSDELSISCAPGTVVRLAGGSVAAPYHQDLLLQRGGGRLEGPAAVSTTWARVVGTSDDALVDVNLYTEENAMPASKASLLVAAAAGSVLTVTVIRGTAEVRPVDAPTSPSLALRAGDTAVAPAGGAPTLASAPTVGVARTDTPAAPPSVAREAPAAPGTADDAPECQPRPDGEECAGAPEPPEGRIAVDIEGAPSLGKLDARVVIVEFGDFQCPFCERAMSTVHELVELYPNDVRIVFKNFPLPTHKNAPLAAEAALAAGEQGKYWEMHDLIYANRERLDRASLESYAAQLGLDMPRFRRALDEHTFAAQVEGDAADARAAGLTGIPTFVINGRVIQGARPLEFFKQIIDEELARTR